MVSPIDTGEFGQKRLLYSEQLGLGSTVNFRFSFSLPTLTVPVYSTGGTNSG